MTKDQLNHLSINGPIPGHPAVYFMLKRLEDGTFQFTIDDNEKELAKSKHFESGSEAADVIKDMKLNGLTPDVMKFISRYHPELKGKLTELVQFLKTL